MQRKIECSEKLKEDVNYFTTWIWIPSGSSVVGNWSVEEIEKSVKWASYISSISQYLLHSLSNNNYYSFLKNSNNVNVVELLCDRLLNNPALNDNQRKIVTYHHHHHHNNIPSIKYHTSNGNDVNESEFILKLAAIVILRKYAMEFIQSLKHHDESLLVTLLLDSVKNSFDVSSTGISADENLFLSAIIAPMTFDEKYADLFPQNEIDEYELGVFLCKLLISIAGFAAPLWLKLHFESLMIACESHPILFSHFYKYLISTNNITMLFKVRQYGGKIPFLIDIQSDQSTIEKFNK